MKRLTLRNGSGEPLTERHGEALVTTRIELNDADKIPCMEYYYVPWQ